MRWTFDKDWADTWRPQIERELRPVVGDIVELVDATVDQDRTEGFDYLIRTKLGNVACRLRRPCDYRDVTIRSRRDTGAITEIDKLRDGHANLYFYGWTAEHSPTFADFIIFHVNRFLAAGLLSGPVTFPMATELGSVLSPAQPCLVSLVASCGQVRTLLPPLEPNGQILTVPQRRPSMTGVTRRVDGRNGGHWYRLDGDKVDGVTTVIGNGVPKPALVPWAAREVATFAVDNLDVIRDLKHDEAIDLLKGAHYRERDRAARRGTEVHRYAEQMIAGEEVDIPEELVGHVDSYIKFLQDFNVQPVLVEAVVGNRTHRWMGTIDLVGDFNDGLRRLADIKTTRSPAPTPKPRCSSPPTETPSSI